MKRDKYGNSGKPGSAGMLCFPSWTSPVRVRSPALNTPMTYTPSESVIPTASSFYELLRAHHRRAFRSGHATRPPPRTDSVQIHLRPHRHVVVHPLDVLVS